jgi:multiple sugar transport system permease protein
MAVSVAPKAPGATANKVARRSKRGGMAIAQRRAGLLFVLPYIIFFLILQLAALVFAFWVSFHHYDLLALDNPFVGLRNYARLTVNQDFLIAMRNTTEYAVVVVILQTVFALLLAVLLDSKIKGRNFFRSTWYTPSIASSVVISMIFLYVYHPTGLLNSILGLVGIHTTEAYLTSTTWALPAIMFLNIWTTAPTFMLMFLAALQDIPREIYEASSVDGASAARRLFSITIPLLRPIIFLVVSLGIIGCFQIFDQALIMTNGGPLKATLTVALLIYNNLFRDTGAVGVACAEAIVLGIIIFALTLISRRVIDTKIEY